MFVGRGKGMEMASKDSLVSHWTFLPKRESPRNTLARSRREAASNPGKGTDATPNRGANSGWNFFSDAATLGEICPSCIFYGPVITVAMMVQLARRCITRRRRRRWCSTGAPLAGKNSGDNSFLSFQPAAAFHAANNGQLKKAS